MKKKLVALLLALLLILPLSSVAEGGGWTCESCGQAGNTGNFCGGCGAQKPAADWTCPGCGQAGNTGNFCGKCGTKKPSGNAEPSAQETVQETVQETAQETAVDPNLEQIPGETDRVKVVLTRTDASSYIKNKDHWIPEHATDGDESTCWQFSATKGGLKGKSWIRLSFSGGQAVDELWFKNGFWAYNTDSGDEYPINARLKDIRVEFCYYGESEFRDAVELTLKDEHWNGWQQFALGRHENVSQIRIAALTSYQGTKFKNDVCLSEVMAVRNAPASGAMPAPEAKEATVYESRPDITGCRLNKPIATRTGPGTQYTESHTFFQDTWQDQTVLVLKKKFDGSVWWVQLDFQNGKKGWYRVWTGADRVKVDLDKVKEEARICDCDIAPTSNTWFGPGGKYTKANIVIHRPAVGTIYQMENGYVDVEYWYEDDGYNGSHRIWIPREAVFNLYYGDYSGQ